VTDDEDPFERLDDAVEDREGDPFDNLGYADDDADGEDPPAAQGGEDQSAEQDDEDGATAADDSAGEEWSQLTSPDDEVVDRPAADVSDSPGESGDDQAAEDRSEMEFGIGRRESEGAPEGPSLSDVGTREGDPFENVQGAFEQMDTGEMDPDAVWQALASAESRGSVGDARERTYAEVDKHSYCEQCEHFSEPPDIACTHEGTDIIEFLDMETVRVVDCPVVAERKELEDS
jgi:hypothetical protein